MSELIQFTEEDYRSVLHSRNLTMDWINSLLHRQHQKSVKDTLEKIVLDKRYDASGYEICDLDTGYNQAVADLENLKQQIAESE